MKVYDVLVSVLVDADNELEAQNNVDLFLLGDKKDLDFNYMIHRVEGTEEGSLEEIRERK